MTRYGFCGPEGAGEIPFVAGDEIVQRFVVLAENTPVDLTGFSISASVWRAGARRDDVLLSVEVDTQAPATGEAHGILRIVETESAKLAGSSGSFIRFTLVDPSDRTMRTAGSGFREITGPAFGVSGMALLRCVLVGVRASDLGSSPPADTYTDDDYAAFAAAA